jgi:hypothetical protein
MPIADFELYDNAGRTTDQIHAYNSNSPTEDDLHRWGATSARPLIDAGGLPPAGQGIARWTELLHQAGSPGEFHGIARAVLSHDDGAVARLHQFLEAAANWYDERGDQTSRRYYSRLADQFDALADEMDQLTVDRAATAYRRGSAAAGHAVPATPPLLPPAPGAVGTTPGTQASRAPRSR